MSVAAKRSDDGLSGVMGKMSLNQESSANGNGNMYGQSNSHSRVSSGEDGAAAANVLTIRALVTSKEAGIIIGKGGANVADLREKSGVKAGVSKVIPGVHDRVMTITGSLEGVAKAYSLIAATIQESSPTLAHRGINAAAESTEGTQESKATIRLLISHSLMGSIIGRQGLKIKQIQDMSGVRMIASKDMLPNSTERSVELQGSLKGIEIAVTEIGKCLMEDSERGQNTLLYQPGMEMMNGGNGMLPNGTMDYQHHNARRGYMGMQSHRSRLNHASDDTAGLAVSNGTSLAAAVNPGGVVVAPTANGATIPSQVVDGDLRVQNISIPSDMVGCIIGKGGSKITEIRRISGSRISIAKVPHDESGERMFTIQGTAESNEKALFLLYNSLEGEKERRAGAAASQLAAGVEQNGE